jgi:large subunit ribosomal protein L18
MKHMTDKIRKRIRRKVSVRKKIFGTVERPRMTIFKSNKYTYLQVIDDSSGFTIVSASNHDKELGDVKNNVKNIGKLGETMGKKLKEKNINSIVFDRNGYKYHGIVKVVADAIRKSGIVF